MTVFKYLWVVILVAIYIGWTIHTFALKKGMSWYGWWKNYGSLWFCIHVSALFFASIIYCVWSAGGVE